MKSRMFILTFVLAITCAAQENAKYSVLLDGAFKAQNGSDPTKDGAIGLKSQSEDYDFTFFVRTSTTGFTLTGSSPTDFGTSILNPTKAGIVFSVDAFAKRLFSERVGGKANVSVATVRWQLVDHLAQVLDEHDGLIGSTDLYISWSPITPSETNDIRASLNIGLTGRVLGGSLSQSKFDTFRQAALGSTEKFFGGLYFSGYFQINDVQVTAGFPVLFGPELEGLTSAQPILTIGISGNFVKFN